MDEEARPRRAMSSQFSRVPSEEGLKRLPRLRERDGPTLGGGGAARKIVRLEFSFETITSLAGTARQRERRYAHTRYVCVFTRARATPSTSTAAYIEPRASARIVRTVRGALAWYQQDRASGYRTYVRSYARTNACRHAGSLSFYESTCGASRNAGNAR